MATKTPSILIPSPYVANNHQYYNALDLVNKKISILIEEKDLDKNTLIKAIDEIFDENTLTPTGYTQYFEKKRASLERLAGYYEGLMQNENLTEEERLDAEKNYIENQGKSISNIFENISKTIL